MRRILSVWLPNWPILRLRRSGAASADVPSATVMSERGQRKLACVCPLAAGAGLRVGQALAEARALVPELEVHEAVPEEDEAALARLADWATRFTPLAAADAPEGLWLDIAGCGHLHGGEQGLCETIARRLAEVGFPARLAVADASGAAWALARFAAGNPVSVLPPGQERAALEGLPVGLLRLEDRAVAALRRVGIRTIGALAREASTIEGGMAAPSGPPEPIKPSFELYAEMLADNGQYADAVKAFVQALLRTPNRTPSVRGLAAARARVTPASTTAPRQ